MIYGLLAQMSDDILFNIFDFHFSWTADRVHPNGDDENIQIDKRIEQKKYKTSKAMIWSLSFLSSVSLPLCYDSVYKNSSHKTE